MRRNSAVVSALALVFALAGCVQVAPSSPGETPLAAFAAGTPVQVSHGNGPFRIEWEITGPGKIGGRIYNECQDGAYQFQLLVQGAWTPRIGS